MEVRTVSYNSSDCSGEKQRETSFVVKDLGDKVDEERVGKIDVDKEKSFNGEHIRSFTATLSPFTEPEVDSITIL